MGRRPKEGGPRRPRVQLDYEQSRIDELKKLAGASDQTSVNDLARTSIKFYKWYLEKKAEGYSFALEKNGKKVVVELLF